MFGPLTVAKRLALGFGMILLLMIVVSLIGNDRVGFIDRTLTSVEDGAADCDCCDECLQECAASGSTSFLAGSALEAPLRSGPKRFVTDWLSGHVRAPPTSLFRPPILDC